MFRAVDAQHQQALRQTAQRWVMNQPAYTALNQTPSPEVAAGLHQAGVLNVPKVWSELAYETVRKEAFPAAPSRLESLYAYLDPLEALSFTEVTGYGKQVWRGEVENGVRWAVVDVSHFSVAQPASADINGFQEAWDRARTQARSYWGSEADVREAEVLVAGPIVLTEQILLVPYLRRIGLVR